jgi:hypothetical protein
MLPAASGLGSTAFGKLGFSATTQQERIES